MTDYNLVRRTITEGVSAYSFHLRRMRAPVDNMAMANPSGWHPLHGNGYLSGAFPGGITTVDAVPTAATVRVIYRPASGSLGDGLLVAEVESAPDGTWRVDGLNPALRYDVVGRKAGLKDVIMSNVQPKVD